MADVTEDGPSFSELLRNVEELGRRGDENEADGRLYGAVQEVQLKYGQRETVISCLIWNSKLLHHYGFIRKE